MKTTRIEIGLSPHAVMRAWPREWRLAALWSGGGSARSRWTLLARPTGEVITTGPGEPIRWPEVMTSAKHAPPELEVDEPPFTSGWLGMMAYELGSVIEPHAGGHAPRAGDFPLMQWQRFDDALAFDHELRQWWGIGRVAALVDAVRCSEGQPAGFTVAPLRSRTGRDAFVESVARAIEHIRAGDIYQVNLTHRLVGSFSGSSREFFLALAASAAPWFAGYIEIESCEHRYAVASASPELFLSVAPRTRRVETRPMKGTRLVPAGHDVAARAELDASVKDRAELAMIVDLMRNDLGRVCAARSIRVDDARAIEAHASLLQTTATISGTLAAGRSLADLLRATFPGGSITGVPKIRAMQIIEELEPLPRGAYCGGLGYVGDDGALHMNIAIRTALIRGDAPQGTTRDAFASAELEYAVGAGIVADSDPGSEWDETIAKADAIRRIAEIASAGS
jgi:para-aminobenzoate synthetase component 1